MKITTLTKTILASLITAVSFGAVAQETATAGDIDQEIRLLVGGKGLATDLGLEYESRDGVVGKTVYAQLGKKRDAENAITANPEQWLLGAGYAVHLRDSSNFDVYVAPSIALIYQKDVDRDGAGPETEKENIFTAGPALKIGSLYTFSRNFTAGAEFVMLNNWFSDRIVASQTYGNAVIGYKF